MSAEIERLSAYNDLMEYLTEGEVVEAIVLGDYGWSDYSEPSGPPVPAEMRGRILTLEEAAPVMSGWSFSGGYGAPSCYAAYIWTSQRVIWVTQYDGSTDLSSAPRHPSACMPEMPGG